MHHIIRRAAIVAGTTTTALALTAGSAFAHECYIAKRSAQGNEAAGMHSQAWYTVDVEQDLFGSLVGEGLWTQNQADCMTEEVSAMGVPMFFTTHVKGAHGVQGVVGGANHQDGWASDGKGVDAWFQSYIGALMTAASAENCDAPIPM